MDILRYLGIAEEASYAVDPAPAAQRHVDMASASLDSPSDTQMVYEGGLGRSPRTHRPGFYAPSGDLVYAFDVRTIARILKWALGGYAHTDDSAGSGFQIHEAYGDDDVLLPSFCARVGKDAFEHVFSGCVVNGLTLEVSDGFAQASVDTQAARDAKAALQAKGDLLLPDEYPLSFVDTTISRAGTDVSALVRSLSLEVANNLRTDSGRGMGSRHPRRNPAGGRQVTGSLTLWYENTDELERLWGDAAGVAAGGSSEHEISIVLSTPTDGDVTLFVPRSIWSQVNLQPSGRDEITQEVNFQAFSEETTLNDASTVETDLLATTRNNEGELIAA